jgi:hypothetical protein
MHEDYKVVVERARDGLKERRIFRSSGAKEYELCELYPVDRWTNETRIWLRNCERTEEELSVIGRDSCGNYFLLLSSGSIAFWDHETDIEAVLSPNLQEFLNGLTSLGPIEMKPGQVKKVWINPDFLKSQKQKGNA